MAQLLKRNVLSARLFVQHYIPTFVELASVHHTGITSIGSRYHGICEMNRSIANEGGISVHAVPELHDPTHTRMLALFTHDYAVIMISTGFIIPRDVALILRTKR